MKTLLILLIAAGLAVAAKADRYCQEHHWAASARPWIHESYYHYEFPRLRAYEWVPRPWYNYLNGPRWIYKNGCYWFYDGAGNWSLRYCY